MTIVPSLYKTGVTIFVSVYAAQVVSHFMCERCVITSHCGQPWLYPLCCIVLVHMAWFWFNHVNNIFSYCAKTDHLIIGTWYGGSPHIQFWCLKLLFCIVLNWACIDTLFPGTIVMGLLNAHHSCFPLIFFFFWWIDMLLNLKDG